MVHKIVDFYKLVNGNNGLAGGEGGMLPLISLTLV